MFLVQTNYPRVGHTEASSGRVGGGGVEPGEAGTWQGKQGNFKVAAERPGGK